MQGGRLQRLIGFQDDVRLSFGWNYSDDVDSAKSMAGAFKEDVPYGVENWSLDSRSRCLEEICAELATCDKLVIIGAAVEQQELSEIDFSNTAVIAADGSVGAMLDFESLTCIVSDLDGGEHIDVAASKSQRFVIHAHGDNVSRWQKVLDNWSAFSNPPSLVLSHQTNESLQGMHNFGGFTDGDRAVCFALWAGVAKDKIELVGFSTQKVGVWSGATNPETKMKKLSWMKKILSFLNLEGQIKD
tara:strand:- start:1479 stop:2210 length:732 start_codon:yes stop_codon:yes gene_type:complete